jgi:hypothetical protein
MNTAAERIITKSHDTQIALDLIKQNPYFSPSEIADKLTGTPFKGMFGAEASQYQRGQYVESLLKPFTIFWIGTSWQARPPAQEKSNSLSVHVTPRRN